MSPFRLNQFLVDLAIVKLISKNILTKGSTHVVRKTTWVSKDSKTSVSLYVCR